jgi:phosphoadenosine phosphosulfate reductase
MGIRAEESRRRAGRPVIDSFSKKVIIYKPIFTWLEFEIWDYIDTHHLPYCSLYDEGFSRLGCVVCPFVDEPKLKIHKARWPKIYAAFEKAMRKLWETRLHPNSDKKPWREETFEQFLDHWYKGK